MAGTAAGVASLIILIAAARLLGKHVVPVVAVLLHLVAMTFLAGPTRIARLVTPLKARIGAHPVEVKAMAGAAAGDASLTIPTAMATLPMMRAALVVVVVPRVSLCECAVSLCDC